MGATDRANQVTVALVDIVLPAGVIIRAWAERDFPAIQALSEAAGWPTPRHRPDEARAAWGHSWPALVATNDDAVIAFLRALTDGEVTLFVPELLVVPAWQHKGLGSALLDTCHALYPHTRIELFATDISAPFYARHGFRPFCGYRKSYR